MSDDDVGMHKGHRLSLFSPADLDLLAIEPVRHLREESRSTCGYCDAPSVAEHATNGPPSRWLPVCDRHAAAHDSDQCTQDQRCRCLCGACDEWCCSKNTRVVLCPECGGAGRCRRCYEGLVVIDIDDGEGQDRE